MPIDRNFSLQFERVIATVFASRRCAEITARDVCMTVAYEDRASILARRRMLKMARSAHAYVRGNTAHFYEWLAASPAARRIPSGPPVWICGDCHLGNLGPVADLDGKVDIQIRDLDQTAIGNPAHDLVRLALSLATAARSSDLPGVTTAHMVAEMLRGYSFAMVPRDEHDAVMVPGVVRSVRKRALGRRWKHLARERIEDRDPTIPLGKKFWALTDDERGAIEALVQQSDVTPRLLALCGQEPDDEVNLIDAAYWRKGCSSLGNLRYALLVGVRQRDKKSQRLALVDIKEAVKALTPTEHEAAMPQDPAERVVAGAMALAPNLGERMIPAHLLGRSVFLRELMPQDLKIEVEQFNRQEAVNASRYLAHVVGLAHARQMTLEERSLWCDMLNRETIGSSWLWDAVVSLAASHECGYLEHCRRYALEV